MFLPAKAPCWNFPKRGGNGASQRSTYPKGYYFYSPQSSTVIKSKMVATTIRTRTRFRPLKIRLHCRLHHLIASHFPYVFLSLAKSSYIPSVSLHFISSFIISSHLIASRHILSKLFTSRLIKPNVQVLHVRSSQLQILLRKRKYLKGKRSTSLWTDTEVSLSLSHFLPSKSVHRQDTDLELSSTAGSAWAEWD